MCSSYGSVNVVMIKTWLCRMEWLDTKGKIDVREIVTDVSFISMLSLIFALFVYVIRY